ncbi:SDH family Clp fold serine proteinase [Ralstonia pseudosolanacearum]
MAQPNDEQKKVQPQFPRGSGVPSQSPKYWVKEKDRYLRQLLIGDIQALTERPLVVYFAQLDQQINHTDPDDLSEILSGIAGDSADLFIQTPGGNVDATEKLIGILRQRLKSWRVIVPSWAKSAGTVIALSGEKILLGINSELGPIDPQFQDPSGMNIPCEILSTDPNQPHHIQQLAGLAVARMRQLALSILQKGMMSAKKVEEAQDVLAKISSSNGYKSHGAVIDYSEALSLGLSVEFLGPDDELWKRIWLLYCMYDHDTKANAIGRLIEGAKFSIARPR